MPDPQPSAAAMRLAEVACDVLWPDRTLRGVGANTDCAIAIALDDAGVGKAVEKLNEIAHGHPPDDWKSWDHLDPYIGYGVSRDTPGYVADVDMSNSGDVHDHGIAVGEWAAAVKASTALAALTGDDDAK